MATTSLSFSETKASRELTKGKHRKKESTAKEEIATSKNRSKSKPSKENCCTVLESSKSSVSCVQEPVWDTEYSEELSVPVPDLYPELSDSLPNIQESDTEQEDMAKVREPHCDSEDNVQCVPTCCGDDDIDNNHNNPCASQSQDDSQLSSSHSQTENSTKHKRKLSKPRKVRKRKSTDLGQDTRTTKEEAEHLYPPQGTGKQGTWVQCSIPSCGKWRFLQNNIDPNEIPERWVCSMNENNGYNACSLSQETFDSQDGNLDVMYTPYPSGAIVWAKMVGYPWWPAMMEDDPDYGYYCETGDDNVTPAMYHVVFFDKEVSRTWVNAVCIRNFSSDDEPEDMGKLSYKGKNYKRQLRTATLAARRAAQMPLQSRLAEYGFAARYKGPIGKKAVEEKERSASLEAEEFSDSESSSQEVYSSGNSYGANSSSSSQERTKQVKPKTPSKSKTPNEKLTNKPAKGKTKRIQQTKGGGSSNKKKENVEKKKKKKAKETIAETSVITAGHDEECLPDNNDGTRADCEIHHIGMSKPIHVQCTEENQKKNGDTPLLTKKLELSVPSTLTPKTDSQQTIHNVNNDKDVKKPSLNEPNELSNINSKVTKVVKKRRMSSEAQGGKKRKISKEANENAENNLKNSVVRKDQETVGENTGTRSESLDKTQKKDDVSEQGKSKKENAAKVDMSHHDDSVKDNQNISELSTSGASKLSVPKEKQPGKTITEAEISVSQEIPVEEEAAANNPRPSETKSSSSQTLESGVKLVSKGKGFDCLKNPTKNVSKKKKTSFEERKGKGSRNSNDKEDPNSEVSEKNEASKDGELPKEHPIPQRPSFTLKRSLASTDVRVAPGEDKAQKKFLPKLVKAFKPPVAKEGKTAKVPKMPKLLKPQFVSPALAKPDSKQAKCKEEGQEVTQEDTVKKNSVTTKEPTLKRKSRKKDDNPSETPKKAKEVTKHEQASDVLSEDLQAEIDEIDNDIASIQKELRVSDTSDTSISEDRIISPTVDHQFLSDSPEF